MLKLLYKPTNNIFTLPDEEALRIKKEDRGNEYLIIEAGIVEEQEPEAITQEEADKLEEALKGVEEDDELTEVPKQEEKKEVLDYKEMTVKELVAFAEQLGVKDVRGKSKAVIYKKIEEFKGV